MSIRVTQPMMYSDMLSRMQRSLSNYMKSNEQGATQKRINAPSDDPAGIYRVLTSRSTIANTKQLQENLDTAKGWLELEDNVLSTQVSTVITRLKELAEQAATGTYTAENRQQIAYEARQQFGTLLNLANTRFEGKSVFGGHKFDASAFQEGLALTSWDTNWNAAIEGGRSRVEGSLDHSVIIQFTSDGLLVDPNDPANNATFRWSGDGGTTWHEDGRAVLDGAEARLDVGSASIYLDPNNPDDPANPLRVADARGKGMNEGGEGTVVYVRPAAFYQGDDGDAPAEVVDMDSASLRGAATGNFNRNVLVRIEDDVDFATGGTEFHWAYSTDDGTSWVHARGTTTGVDVRLPVPGGFVELQAQANPVSAGSTVLIHPHRADLDYEILEDTFITVNGVGKDIFGGYCQNTPAISGNKNLLEVAGAFVAYLENNNQEGCQRTLAALSEAQQHILTQSARIGGKENRLEVAADVLKYQKLDQQERLSYVEDIDLTELVTKLSQQQLIYQTVLQSSSRIMQLGLAQYL